MEFVADYGLFLLETVTIVLAVILVIAASSKISGGSDEPKGAIKITDLSKKLADQAKQVSTSVNTALAEEKASLLERLKKRFRKATRDTSEKSPKKERLAVVIEFKGDMKA